MPKLAKRMVTLPREHADYIDRLVASGTFASTSEVLRAGLRALQERDEAVECWLRDDVAPAYDAMKAHPERGLPAKAVFEELRARHGDRIKETR